MRNPYKLGNYVKAVNRSTEGSAPVRSAIVNTLKWVLSQKAAPPLSVDYKVPPRKGITKKIAARRARRKAQGRRLRSVPKTEAAA